MEMQNFQNVLEIHEQCVERITKSNFLCYTSYTTLKNQF